MAEILACSWAALPLMKLLDKSHGLFSLQHGIA
jgi:hypothetical protein